VIKTPLDRVGIVMMSAVGDAVHVLPLLTALKRHSPRTRVTWVLQPGAATLVRGHWALDEIIEFDRSRGWRAYPAVRSELAARVKDVTMPALK
jgi:heptosyltransferase I